MAGAASGRRAASCFRVFCGGRRASCRAPICGCRSTSALKGLVLFFAATAVTAHARRRPYQDGDFRRDRLVGPGDQRSRDHRPERNLRGRRSRCDWRSAPIPRSSRSTRSRRASASRQLPWVKRVTIRKLYPDTLQVAISEREPYAIWQHDGRVVLITKDGKVISDHVDAALQEPADGRRRRRRRAGQRIRLAPRGVSDLRPPRQRRRPGHRPALERGAQQWRRDHAARGGSGIGADPGRRPRRRARHPLPRDRRGRPAAAQPAGLPPDREGLRGARGAPQGAQARRARTPDEDCSAIPTRSAPSSVGRRSSRSSTSARARSAA